MEKLNVVHGLDPYKFPNNEWTVDPDLLPPMSHPNVFLYFSVSSGLKALSNSDIRNRVACTVHKRV